MDGQRTANRGASEVADEAILVMIVVVLSTLTIGAFVTYSEETFDVGPTASFSFEWDDEPGSSDVLNVTFKTGEPVEAGTLFVRGKRGEDANDGTGCSSETLADLDSVWYRLPATDAGGPFSQVAAGRTAKVRCIGSDGEVRVVWHSEAKNQSATLGVWEGPAA
jgi:hypothetical protein